MIEEPPGVDRQETLSSLSINKEHEPPDDELPGIADPGHVIWRGISAVVAVPVLMVFTTGVELLLLGRGDSLAMNDHATYKAFIDGLGGRPIAGGVEFGVNGQPISTLGGQARKHTFRQRGWIAGTDRDLVFSLRWPDVGIEYAERVVAQALIADAARKIVRI